MLNRLLFIGLIASILGLLFLGSRLEQSDAPKTASGAGALETDPFLDSRLLKNSRAASRVPAAASTETRLEIEPVTADENPSLPTGPSVE